MSPRRTDEVCMFCGMLPCECAGPPKKRVAKKKAKPAVAATPPPPRRAGPARVKVVELPPEPIKVAKIKPNVRRVTPESIALHRALEAFAEHDMLPPEAYRKYPDLHPPKNKNLRR